MRDVKETEISRAILDAWHEKLSSAIESDVIIVGAGPSGLVAASQLAGDGFNVVVIEKRLSPGGGIWGGGIGMNEVVVQEDAGELLRDFGISGRERGAGFYTVDAVELASGLCLQAIRSGATLINMMESEDLCLSDGRVTGVVANRTTILGNLPVDPIAFSGAAVVDATGHEAALVGFLRDRGLQIAGDRGDYDVEGPMDAAAGERFVSENVTEVYPGLWICGMAVCAVLGGPRMGPIFGGMLLSGLAVAEQVSASMKR